MGFSAGGNLVAQGGDTEHTPLENEKRPDRRGEFKTQCADSCVTPFRLSNVTQRQWKTFPGDLGTEQADAFSPDKKKHFERVHPPPAFIWHTFADEAVDVRNALSTLPRAKKKTCRLNCMFFEWATRTPVLRRSSRTPAGQWPELLQLAETYRLFHGE